MKVNHSQMLTTRRRKKRGKKQLAVIAKRAKKLRNQKVQMASAEAAKEEPA